MPTRLLALCTAAACAALLAAAPAEAQGVAEDDVSGAATRKLLGRRGDARELGDDDEPMVCPSYSDVIKVPQNQRWKYFDCKTCDCGCPNMPWRSNPKSPFPACVRRVKLSVTADLIGVCPDLAVVQGTPKKDRWKNFDCPRCNCGCRTLAGCGSEYPCCVKTVDKAIIQKARQQEMEDEEADEKEQAQLTKGGTCPSKKVSTCSFGAVEKFLPTVAKKGANALVREYDYEVPFGFSLPTVVSGGDWTVTTTPTDVSGVAACSGILTSAATSKYCAVSNINSEVQAGNEEESGNSACVAVEPVRGIVSVLLSKKIKLTYGVVTVELDRFMLSRYDCGQVTLNNYIDITGKTVSGKKFPAQFTLKGNVVIDKTSNFDMFQWNGKTVVDATIGYSGEATIFASAGTKGPLSALQSMFTDAKLPGSFRAGIMFEATPSISVKLLKYQFDLNVGVTGGKTQVVGAFDKNGLVELQITAAVKIASPINILFGTVKAAEVLTKILCPLDVLPKALETLFYCNGAQPPIATSVATILIKRNGWGLSLKLGSIVFSASLGEKGIQLCAGGDGDCLGPFCTSDSMCPGESYCNMLDDPRKVQGKCYPKQNNDADGAVAKCALKTVKGESTCTSKDQCKSGRCNLGCCVECQNDAQCRSDRGSKYMCLGLDFGSKFTCALLGRYGDRCSNMFNRPMFGKQCGLAKSSCGNKQCQSGICDSPSTSLVGELIDATASYDECKECTKSNTRCCKTNKCSKKGRCIDADRDSYGFILSGPCGKGWKSAIEKAEADGDIAEKGNDAIPSGGRSLPGLVLAASLALLAQL